MKRLILLSAILPLLAMAQKPPAVLPSSQPAAAAKPPVKPPEKAAEPAAKPVNAPSVKDLKFPPLRPIQIPKVETVTLSNGMKLFLLEDHELPIINGTALVRTGNLFDPSDKVGLAGITGTAMRSGGTKDKTGDELDEQLENIAATVESSIGETSGSVSFTSLKETADSVMVVFRDVMTAPEFRPERIELAKTQMRSQIARRNDDPHGIVEREFADLVYGKDTPFGWRIEYETINRITRDDLIQFHRRYFFPANVMLAIRGDFDAAAMKAKVEQLFAGWTAQQPPVPEFPKVNKTPRPNTYLAVKKDVTQTSFVMGQLGGEYRDKDYPALTVLADILGGGFSSRLVKRVRSREGAAYDISASWAANFDHPGTFQIAGSTKSMSTVQTLRSVREELEKVRTTEVSADELETAKQAALNSLVFAFDTKAKTLGRILTYEYFGYPRDFIDRYQKALAAVTRADVLRVAKQYLMPEQMTIVTVGNPDEFVTPLPALGRPVTDIDLKIPEPKVEMPKADPASLAAGKSMMAKMQAAVGGSERLAAVKDAVVSFTIKFVQEGAIVKERDRWAAPSNFRQDAEFPQGKMSAFTDGQAGWMAAGRSVGPLGGLQLKQVQSDLFHFYLRMIQADRFGCQVNGTGPNTVEISDGSGQSTKLSFDPETGLPARIVYQSVPIDGPPATVEEVFSDFRDIGGLKVPFKSNVTQAGAKYVETEVQEYQINTGLKPGDLGMRSQ